MAGVIDPGKGVQVGDKVLVHDGTSSPPSDRGTVTHVHGDSFSGTLDPPLVGTFHATIARYRDTWRWA